MNTERTETPVNGGYCIMDMHTQQIVSGPYACIKRANRRVNALDHEYGAYRYCVVNENKNTTI